MDKGKLILFYSSYCQFSRDIINHIVKKDLKPNFVFIPVETNKHRIPPQIDRVPALITTEGDILFEDDIVSFINSATEDIMPLEQPSSGYSDNFSFLGEDDQNKGTSNTLLKNFAPFGTEQRIHTPEEDGGTGKGGGMNSDMDMKVMSNLQSQRDREIKSIFGETRRM
jgi:hypothetical protein